MKKLLALIMALVMMMALAACGDEEGAEGPVAPADGQQQAEPAAPVEPADEGEPAIGDVEMGDSKTAKYFSKFADGEYTMEMETYDAESGMTVTVLSAYKDDMIYSEVDMAEAGKMITIVRDGFMYMLDPATMTSTKMAESGVQETEELAMDDMVAGTGIYATYTEGSMEIDGKKYDYEEFEGSERFCFDGKDLVYVVSMEDGQIMATSKIISMSDKADKKLFEIPDGYTETDMSALMDDAGVDLSEYGIDMDDFNIDDFNMDDFNMGEY